MSLPSLARLSLHDLHPPAPTAGGEDHGQKPWETYYHKGAKPESKPATSKGKIEAATRLQCARLPNVDVRFKTRESINLQQPPIDLANKYHFDFTWTGEDATKGECKMKMVAEFIWSFTRTAGPMWYDVHSEENYRPYEDKDKKKVDRQTVKLVLFIYLVPEKGVSVEDAAQWSLAIPLVSLAFVETALAARGEDKLPYVVKPEEGKPYFDLDKFLNDRIPFFSNNYKWKRGKLCHPMKHLTAMFALATDHIVDYMLPGRVVQLHDHAISDFHTTTFVRALAKVVGETLTPDEYAKRLGVQKPVDEGFEFGGTYTELDQNNWIRMTVTDSLNTIIKHVAEDMLWRAPYYERNLGAEFDQSDLLEARTEIEKLLSTQGLNFADWLRKAMQTPSPALRELIERTIRRKHMKTKPESQLPKDVETRLVEQVVEACGKVNSVETVIDGAGLKVSVPFTIRFGKNVAQMPDAEEKRKAALDSAVNYPPSVTRTVVDSGRDADLSDDSGDEPSKGSSSDDAGDSADSSDERADYAQKPGFKPRPACRRRKLERGQYTRLQKLPRKGRKPPDDVKPEHVESPETSENESGPEPDSPDGRSEDLDYDSDKEPRR